MIILMGKHDDILKVHLYSYKNSTYYVIIGTCSKQGGGLISFLSKITVHYITEMIIQNIKSSISEEIKEARIFSVLLDTIQDISVIGQCSVIIRYVKDNSVCERLVSMIKCTSTKGINFI